MSTIIVDKRSGDVEESKLNFVSTVKDIVAADKAKYEGIANKVKGYSDKFDQEVFEEDNEPCVRLDEKITILDAIQGGESTGYTE